MNGVSCFGFCVVWRKLMFFRKTILSFFMSTCFLGGNAFADSVSQDAKKEYKGIVTYVLDGDRFLLESNNETHLVKLKWLNAPDDGQLLADESLTFLNELILGREVIVLSNGDNNGCLFGELIADGVNYNQEVIRSGLAHTYDDAPSEYHLSENSAKKEKRGIWSLENTVQPNSSWVSIADLGNGCQLDRDIVDYQTEKGLMSGRERYRHLLIPFYLLLSSFAGFLLWVGINRFDDPRIAIKKRRLERNKAEIKQAKKNGKNRQAPDAIDVEMDKEEKK